MSSQIAIITNPYAGKNKSHASHVSQLNSILGNHGVIKETRNLEQLRTALEELMNQNILYLLCDGGDGTIHWVINTLYEIGKQRKVKNFMSEIPIVVPTNGGTIDFIAERAKVKGKTLNISRAIVEQLKNNSRLASVSLPSIKVTGEIKTSNGSKSFEKLGFVTAIAGASQRFFEKYYANNNPSSGTIIEIIARTTLSQFSQFTKMDKWLPEEVSQYSKTLFTPQEAEVKVDGKLLPYKHYTAINAGSIAINLKGVIKLFSDAGNGKPLHVQAGALTPGEIIANIPNLYAGNKFIGKDLFEDNVEVMEVEAKGDKLLNPIIDGEYFEGLKYLKVSSGPCIKMASIDASK